MKKRKLIAVLSLFAIILSVTAIVISASSGASDDKTINVWLIAGQSNAVGYGDINNYPDGYDAELFDRGVENVLYYGKGYGRDSESFMPVRFSQGNGVQYSGAELGIASALANSGEKHAIIKYANGDTQLSTLRNSANATEDFKTWTPPSADRGSFSNSGALYDGFIATVKEGIELLIKDGYTPVIQGFWWMQGERDGNYGDMTAELYASLLKALISDMRADVGAIVRRDLSAAPFVFGRVYRNPAYAPNSEAGLAAVQAGQDAVAADTSLKNVSMIDTRYDLIDPKTGAEKELVQQDGWHYDSFTQQLIGEAFVRRVNTLKGTPYQHTESVGILKGETALYTATVNYLPGTSTTVKLGSYEMFSVSDEAFKMLNATVNMTYGYGDYTLYISISPDANMTMVEVKLPDGGIMRKGVANKNAGSSIVATSTDAARVKNVTLCYENLVLNEYELVSVEPAAEGFGKNVYNIMNSFSDATSTRLFAWTAKADFIGSREMAIKYRAAGSTEWSVAQAYKMTEPTEYAAEDYFKADVSGLAADTDYEYRIGVKDSSDEENEWSKSYFFSTAKGDEKEFTFIAVGDTQGITWNGTEIANKGFMYSKAAFDEAFKEVEDPAFILHTGDVVENGTNVDQWNYYFKALGEAGASVPHFAAIGNHDQELFSSNQNLYFGMHFNHPDNGGNDYLDESVVGAINGLTNNDAAWSQMLIKEMDETFYSYNYGDAHFIVYNSGNYSSNDELVMKAQRAWLKADLEANKDAKWTIVMAHQANYHRFEGSYHRSTLADILEGFDVDLVIQGHSHLVTRTYPIKNGEAVSTDNLDKITKGEGTVYMLVGAGALNHDRLDDYPNTKETAVVVSQEKIQATYATFHVTEDSIEVTVKQVDGLVLDSFTIAYEEEEEAQGAPAANIVYNDDFHYFTYSDLNALGLWETENSGKYNAKSPSYSAQRIKLTDGQSVQFNWLKLIGAENYNSSNTYVFEFDANVKNWGDNSSASTRALYVAPGGYYNQVGLRHSDTTMQVGETTSHACTYTSEETFRIRLEWCGSEITSTVTDSSGRVVTGSRNKTNYTSVLTDPLLQTLVLRCEDGEVYIDNFTFTEQKPVVIDGYGTLPSKYADADRYPIVLFHKGEFKQAFAPDQFTAATTAAQALVDYNVTDLADAKILLRGDASAKDNNQNLGRAIGKINVNLGGYTLTHAQGSSLFFLRTKCYDTSATASTNQKTFYLNVYNGNIVLNNYLFETGAQQSGSTEALLNNAKVEFTNVNISIKRGKVFNNPEISMIIRAGSSSTKSGDTEVEFNLTFNDCTFDLSRYHYNSTVFNMNQANDPATSVHKFNINVNGGEIILSPYLKDVKVYDANAVSAITFGAGADGEYLKLTVPTGVKAKTLNNKSFSIGGENAEFIESEKDTLFTTYNLEVAEELSEDVYIEGYGTIPSAYADADAYPIVLFQGGEFKQAFASGMFAEATNAARALVDYNKVDPAPAQILLRGNASTTSYGDQNLARAVGVIDINLNGYTLTQDYSDYLFLIRIKDYDAKEQKFTLNIRDGKINLGWVMFGLSAQSGVSNSKLNSAEINVTNVDFSLIGQTPNAGPFFGIAQGGNGNTSGDTDMDIDVTFTDCTFDLSSMNKANYLFNAAQTTDKSVVINMDVKVMGGEIIVGKGGSEGTKPYATSLYALNTTSSITLGKGSDGEYLKLTVPADVTTYIQNNLNYQWAQFKTPFYLDEPITYNGTESSSSGTWAEYVAVSAYGNYKTYALKTPVYIEGYGTVPAEFSDAGQYPIVLFQDGVFRGAYKYFSHSDMALSAITAAKNLVPSYDGDMSKAPAPAMMLFRGDAEALYNEQNIGQSVGEININLGGHTLIHNNGSTLFFLRTKTYSATAQKFIFNVYGGNILLKGTLFGFGTQENADYEQFKSAEINFTNVNITVPRGSSISNILASYTYGPITSYKNVNYDVTFNGCVIDLSEVASNGTVFNINDSTATLKTAIDFTMLGGKILLSEDIADTDLYTTNGVSTFTFGKGADGKYTVIEAPSGAKLNATNCVATDANGSEFLFTKRYDDGVKAGYSLTPKGLRDFGLKTNVTLYSDFVLNAYFPKLNEITLVTVNGVTVDLTTLETTEIDGKTYYILPTEVAASEAAEDVTVVITLTYGENSFSGKWTLGVVKYAEKALAMVESEITKTMLRDMLSYVRASYEYFATVGQVTPEACEAAVAKITAIIGEDYDKNNSPEMNEEAVLDVEGLSKATVALGAKISFVFYPTEDAEKYSFTMNGAKLETKIAEGGYIIVTTYAYAIKETVEYTVEGTDISGSYNLKAYYEYMVGEGNGSAELIALVERLFKYSESCESYRNEVNS